MESNIAPLAKRLAEENNVNWKNLDGSGPDGRIIERDVLEYLARVMAGEESVDPTPEPVPEGIDAWPEEDVGESTAAPPERTPADAEEAEDDGFDDVFGDFDDEALLEPEEAAPPATTAAKAVAAAPLEAEESVSDDIFLFDEDDEEEIAAVHEESTQTTHEGAAIRDDEEEIDFSELDELDDFDLDETPSEDDDEDARAAVDLEFGDEDEDFGEGVETETAHALEDEDDAVFDFEDDLIGSLGEDEGLSQAAQDSSNDNLDDLFADDEDIFDELPREEPVDVFDFEGDDLGSREVAAATESPPGVEEPEEFADDDAFLPVDAVDEGSVEDETPREEEEVAEAEGAVSFDPEDTLDIDRDDAYEPRRDAYAAEPQEAQTSAEAEPDLAAAEAFDETSDDTAAEQAGLAAAAQVEDDTPLEPTETVPAEHDVLPLTSYGQVLRRHLELSELAKAQLGVGRELQGGDPVSPAVFLLRAAAKVLQESPLAGDVRVGLAILSEQGVGVQVIPNAAEARFEELHNAVLKAKASRTTERQGAALIVADMSELDVDEAVLALGAPLLTLGRILYDKTSAGYRSTLSLSGEVNPEQGAVLLRRVNELLDEPIRLLL